LRGAGGLLLRDGRLVRLSGRADPGRRHADLAALGAGALHPVGDPDRCRALRPLRAADPSGAAVGGAARPPCERDRPHHRGNTRMIALAMLAGLFLLVLINVPIAVSLGLVAMTALWHSYGFDSLLNMAVVLFEGSTKFPLLAIPLFVLAGA